MDLYGVQWRDCRPTINGEEFTRCPNRSSQDCMCCCGPAISGGAHEEQHSDVIEDVVEDAIEDVMEDALTQYFNDGHICCKNCRCKTVPAYAKKMIERIDRILASAQNIHRRHRVRHATIMTRRLTGVCSCGSPESECNWTQCSHRWIATLGTQPKRKASTNSLHVHRAKMLRKLYSQRCRETKLTCMHEEHTCTRRKLF